MKTEINGFVFEDMEYRPSVTEERVLAGKDAAKDGKPDYSLLPDAFLTQVARAMMAGER